VLGAASAGPSNCGRFIDLSLPLGM
jgi:hypothetical protein